MVFTTLKNEDSKRVEGDWTGSASVFARASRTHLHGGKWCALSAALALSACTNSGSVGLSQSILPGYSSAQPSGASTEAQSREQPGASSERRSDSVAGMASGKDGQRGTTGQASRANEKRPGAGERRSSDQKANADSYANSVPTSPCDTSVIVARYQDASGGKQCLDSSALSSALSGTGFTASRMHDCSTLSSLKTRLEQAGANLTANLVSSLTMTWYLKASDGQAIDSSDLQLLASRGFSSFESSCPISGMSSDIGTPRREEKPRRNRGKAGKTSGASGSATTGYAPMSGWHLMQTGIGGPTGVASYMNSDAKFKSHRIRVAVIDSGIDPDLPSPALLKTELGWSFEQDDLGRPASDRPWLDDDLGHGTAVANIITEASAAQTELVSVKVLNRNGRGSQARLARGILKAGVDFQAQLVNLSLAYPRRDSAMYGQQWLYLAEPLAALYALGTRSFAAAGNSCGDPSIPCEQFYPASVPDIMATTSYPLMVTSVRGYNAEGVKSTQSASCMSDIGAPSEFICAWHPNSADWAGYQLGSGTSFAVPQVVGATALLTSWKGNLTTAGLDAARNALLTKGNAGRLDVCQAAASLGLPVGACTTWGAYLDPASIPCLESKPVDSTGKATYDTYSVNVELAGYTSSASYGTGSAATPIEQGCDARWCSGMYSAPSTPICTSCDYCITSDAKTVNLMLQLASDLSSYTDFQLRLTTRAGTYLYFDLPDLKAYAGTGFELANTIRTGSLSTSDKEATILGLGTDGLWSGTPLMRTSCP